MAAAIASTPSVRKRAGRFLLHYGEMCLPMCIGFAVGDALYLSAAGSFGYSEPFEQLPELSVVVVTLAMTAPMTVWMGYRGMPRRATAEMSAAMPVLAVALLAFGWLELVPREDLVVLEHGLMMPVMLVPMLARLDLYDGRARHGHRPHPRRLRDVRRRKIEGAESR
jgi:flagellar biosynthetic protein FliP